MARRNHNLILVLGLIQLIFLGCATTQKARVFNLNIATGAEPISRKIVPDTLSEDERQNFTIWKLKLSLIVPGGLRGSKKIQETDSTMGMEVIHGKGGLLIEIGVERGNMIYEGPLICLRAIDFISTQKQRYGCATVSDSSEEKQHITCFTGHPKYGTMALAAFVCKSTSKTEVETVEVIAVCGTFLDHENNPAQLFVTIGIPKEKFFRGGDRMVMGILESIRIEGIKPFNI